MNFENENFDKFESQLNEDLLNDDVDSLFDLAEGCTFGLKSTAVNDFKFEEIIMQKLKINTEFSGVGIINHQQSLFKEDIQEVKFHHTNEAYLVASHHSSCMNEEDLSLFDEKNPLPEENVKEEEDQNEEVQKEESIVHKEPKTQRVPRKYKINRKECSTDGKEKKTRFGKKQDLGKSFFFCFFNK